MSDNSPQVFDCERLSITVLLVDDDTNSLSLIAGFLRSWQYKVATATSGHEALKTLKEFRGFFDLVIAEMNLRGMNGLELQKHVKCQFNLPVIIMSSDRRKSVMRRSLDHGAAYCIAKPVQREDLKDVWQYAVAGGRQKLRVQNDKVVSVSEEEEGDSSSATAINVASSSQDSTLVKKQRKKYCKRKRSEVVENDEIIFCGPKRSKIFWTTNLHNRFLLAINHIGMDKAVPTKILEIMNVPGLTRENVASHLQKYRIFLRKIADKGIIEGLSERALRSRFAMGLPTDLIKDLKRRVSQFRQQDNHHHQPYSNTISSRSLATTKPSWNQTIPLLSNQTNIAQPNYYGTNHTYKHFQQTPFHNQPIHHRSIANNGGHMTSTNALTSSSNLMSNYASLGNNRNFNYLSSNYGSYNNNLGMVAPYRGFGLQQSPSSTYNYNNHLGTQLNNNNNRGMMVPFYGSSGLHQSTASTNNNHHGTQLNNNSGMIVPFYGSSGLHQSSASTNSNHHGTQLNNNSGMIMPFYGSSGLHQSTASTYNNYHGNQLNNNNASLILDATNRVQNVDYSNYYNRSTNSISGLLSNGSASNSAFVPAPSSSGVNVYDEESNRAIITTVGLPSMLQKSINNGVRINAGGGNHDQNNTITSLNQRANEGGQMDDLNELFLMLNDMVLPAEVVSNQTTESYHADEQSSSDILSSLNAEEFIDLFQGDGDHVNTQTSERSVNVFPNNSSSCTNENFNTVVSNDVYSNLEPLDKFMTDSSTGNTTTAPEQDLDMDLIESLLFGATDLN